MGDLTSRETPTPSSIDTGLWATRPQSSPTPGPDSQWARGADRADAEVLGEAVVGCDVLVQLLDGPLPQAGAVVALVQVEDRCEGGGASTGTRHGEESQPQHRPPRAVGPRRPVSGPPLVTPSPTLLACWCSPLPGILVLPCSPRSRAEHVASQCRQGGSRLPPQGPSAGPVRERTNE